MSGCEQAIAGHGISNRTCLHRHYDLGETQSIQGSHLAFGGLDKDTGADFHQPGIIGGLASTGTFIDSRKILGQAAGVYPYPYGNTFAGSLGSHFPQFPGSPQIAGIDPDLCNGEIEAAQGYAPVKVDIRNQGQVYPGRQSAKSLYVIHGRYGKTQDSAAKTCQDAYPGHSGIQILRCKLILPHGLHRWWMPAPDKNAAYLYYPGILSHAGDYTL
jgi:hypothetical protein